MFSGTDWYTTALIRLGKRLDSICAVRSLARSLARDHGETLIEEREAPEPRDFRGPRARAPMLPGHGIKRANAAISYWHGRGMPSGRSLIKPITS